MYESVAILNAITVPSGWYKSSYTGVFNANLIMGNGSSNGYHCWAKIPGTNFLTNSNGNWNTNEPSDTCVT